MLYFFDDKISQILHFFDDKISQMLHFFEDKEEVEDVIFYYTFSTDYHFALK